MSISSSSQSLIPVVKRKRGVKRGVKRQKYNVTTVEAKRRIITAAENLEDWRAVARANGCNVNTARRWVVNGEKCFEVKPRGGTRKEVVKFMEDHKKFLIAVLEENCQASLKYLSERLRNHPDPDIAVNVSTSTIKRHLDGACFTLKKVIGVPVGVNTDANKTKRKMFLEQLLRLTSEHKIIYYQDESN